MVFKGAGSHRPWVTAGGSLTGRQERKGTPEALPACAPSHLWGPSASHLPWLEVKSLREGVTQLCLPCDTALGVGWGGVVASGPSCPSESPGWSLCHWPGGNSGGISASLLHPPPAPEVSSESPLRACLAAGVLCGQQHRPS